MAVGRGVVLLGWLGGRPWIRGNFLIDTVYALSRFEEW